VPYHSFRGLLPIESVSVRFHARQQAQQRALLAIEASGLILAHQNSSGPYGFFFFWRRWLLRIGETGMVP
jgi:hypothetical protein